jgi:hypothetical protein
MRPQLEAQCTTTMTSEGDTTSETGTTYTRAPRVELQPRRTARNRGDTLSLGYLKIRPTKKTSVPGPQGDKGRATQANRPQSRVQPRGAHPGYRCRGWGPAWRITTDASRISALPRISKTLVGSPFIQCICRLATRWRWSGESTLASMAGSSG